jgi:CRP/FNR family transcriptional regulator, dissimilatory nitrate respiration regulator
MTSVVDILTDCRLFTAVPPRSFQRLVAIARLAKFRKGQVIFRENDECPGVYVVGKGMVRVFKTAPGGKEHVLHIVEVGGTFAEVAALGGFKVPATAEAVETTQCALLPQPAFRKALEEDHPLCLGMLSGLSLWVKHLVGLLEDVVLRDAAGRIANYLLDARRADDGEVALPSLKRYVASHLNLTSETFSRTFRRLLDAGLISLGEKNHVRIIAPERLLRIAQGTLPVV